MTPNRRRRVTFGESVVQQYDDNQSPNNLSTTLTRTVSSPLSRVSSPTSILSRIQRVTAPTMRNIGEDNINYNPPELQISTTTKSDNGEGSTSQTLTTQAQNVSRTAFGGNFAPRDSQVSTEARNGGSTSRTTTTTFTRQISTPVTSVHVLGFPKIGIHGRYHHNRHHHNHTQEYQLMAQRQLLFDTLSAQEQILQERWAQTQLSMTHEPCVQGFDWYRVPGGYECYGGSHGVPDELLVEGRGGWMLRNRNVPDAEWFGPVYSFEEQEMWIENLIASGRWF